MRSTFIEYNPNGAWAMNKKLAAGGPFADWGVYDLAFHFGLLDDVPQLKSLRSFSRNDLRDMSKLVDFSDVEQHGAAWMEFDTGLTYYYEHAAPEYTLRQRMKPGCMGQEAACGSNSPPGRPMRLNSSIWRMVSRAKRPIRSI